MSDTNDVKKILNAASSREEADVPAVPSAADDNRTRPPSASVRRRSMARLRGFDELAAS